MGHYRVTSQAEEDLSDIWLYIAQDNIDAAEQLADAIVAKYQVLADQPRVGALRDDLATGLRSHVHGNYLILYRPITDGVEVVRVLHGARDYPRLFDD